MLQYLISYSRLCAVTWYFNGSNFGQLWKIWICWAKNAQNCTWASNKNNMKSKSNQPRGMDYIFSHLEIQHKFQTNIYCNECQSIFVILSEILNFILKLWHLSMKMANVYCKQIALWSGFHRLTSVELFKQFIYMFYEQVVIYKKKNPKIARVTAKSKRGIFCPKRLCIVYEPQWL